MPRKLILFILFLPSLFVAQTLFSGKNSDRNYLVVQQVFEKYEEAQDSIQLKKLIFQASKEYQFRDIQSLVVIQNIFIANKYADIKDELNAISDLYYKKALNAAKEQKRTDLKIWAEINYAYYLYHFREYKLAFPHFMYCIKEIDQNPEQNILQYDKTYIRIGFFTCTIGEYEKSIEYLKKAQQRLPPNSPELPMILDNIGMAFINMKNYGEAESYLKRALRLSELMNDRIRYAKVLGNFGTLKMGQGKYSEAQKFFKKDILISDENGDSKNTMYALIQLSKAYIEDHKVQEASSALSRASEISKLKPYFKSSELEIVQFQKEIAELTKDQAEEFRLRKKIDTLKKALENLDGEEAIAKINWDTQKEIFQAQIESEKEKSEKESVQKIAALVFSLFMIVLIISIVRFLKTKHKAEKSEFDKKMLSLVLDKVNSENKLNASEQTIQSYRTYLSEKNQQIKTLEIEIEKIKNTSSSDYETRKSDLQRLLDSHLMTQENWEKFRLAYIQEYAEDYRQIQEHFPDLTDSNLRIIILSRLGMSNSEMSGILGVTVEAVKKARQRLRKKYENDTNSLFEH